MDDCSHRDTLLIAIINSFTSILAGFVIFSAFGYMSYLQGIPVSQLAVDGEKKIKEKKGQSIVHFKVFYRATRVYACQLCYRHPMCY